MGWDFRPRSFQDGSLDLDIWQPIHPISAPCNADDRSVADNISLELSRPLKWPTGRDRDKGMMGLPEHGTPQLICGFHQPIDLI